MTSRQAFATRFAQLPLIAILRGVRPNEVVGIGEALVSAGFRLIEVPLNSPDPLDSIARLAAHLEGRAMVGAGTVLTANDVDTVAAAGGTLIIAPNTDPRVITAADRAGLVPIPGFSTPSEAFSALQAGAAALKLFPAEGSSPATLKAMRAVIPADIGILPVGGITPAAMGQWMAAGASGFGLGSALYRPGDTPEAVGRNARQFLAAWQDAGGTR